MTVENEKGFGSNVYNGYIKPVGVWFYGVGESAASGVSYGFNKYVAPTATWAWNGLGNGVTVVVDGTKHVFNDYVAPTATWAWNGVYNGVSHGVTTVSNAGSNVYHYFFPVKEVQVADYNDTSTTTISETSSFTPVELTSTNGDISTSDSIQLSVVGETQTTDTTLIQ